MGINKDQVEGRAREATGKVKEVVGHAVGNQKLENKGKLEKSVGAVQSSLGDAEETIKNTFKKP